MAEHHLLADIEVDAAPEIDRVNVEPAILLGLSSSEALWTIGVAFAIWIPIAGVIAAKRDRRRAATVLREHARRLTAGRELDQRQVAPVLLADAGLGSAKADAGDGEQGFGHEARAQRRTNEPGAAGDENELGHGIRMARQALRSP